MTMLDTAATMNVTRAEAKALLKEYHRARLAPTSEDRAIMAAYRAIAAGRAVISVDASIREAGWNPDGTSKLAMTRANVRRIRANFSRESVSFWDDSSRGYAAHYEVRGMPQNPKGWGPNNTAIVPLIPLPHRPKHNLRNYWILWEADWRVAPRDPLLLRKTQGDLWIVLAAWDLTDVERAVLERRFNS